MQAPKATELGTEQRQRIAREHSALFPTRLALARWTSSNEVPHLHEHHPPLRAAWLARAQRDFQCWLDCGGFVQHDHEHPHAARPGDGHAARPGDGHDAQVPAL